MKRKKMIYATVIGLCMVMCGCGGSSQKDDTGSEVVPSTSTSEETTSENNKERLYQIGEVATSDSVEIILTSVNYDDFVKQGGHTIYPKEGNKFITLEYSVKNVGKKDLTAIIPINGGKSTFLRDMPYIDYNDGYTFIVDDVEGKNGEHYKTGLGLGFFHEPNDGSIHDLKVMGEAQQCMVNILVPDEVVSNKSAPLLVGFSVPSEDGPTTILYKIR